MDNLLFGILTITACTAGYFYSWKAWRKDNYLQAVLLLIACGLVLRLFTASDFFLHPWDERYHALVAKNLMEHPLVPTLYDNPVLPYDYKSWISSHIWLHKQPMPLWGMAASMRLFGVNEIALRLPSIILTTIGIWLTFSIGSYFLNRQAGYLAAFLYSINGLIIEITAGRIATDHIDAFFLFFIELAVFFSVLFVKKKNPIFNVLAGVSMGAAILSKWLPALIVLPIWVLIVTESGNFKLKQALLHFTLLIISSILVFLPWQIYIFRVFPLEASWEAGFNMKHITTALEGRTGPFYYFLDKIRINYGELIYLPLLWFLWKTFRNPLNYKYLAITTWFLVPLLFFSFVKTKMQAYLLFTSPALFLMTAAFYLMLSDQDRRGWKKWLINLILILLIALPARYAIERIKPFDRTDRNPAWTADLKALKETNIQDGIMFNYDRPIEAMFYTGLTVYPYIPEKKIIDSLITEGHTVILNNNADLPHEITEIPGVKMVNLSKAPP